LVAEEDPPVDAVPVEDWLVLDVDADPLLLLASPAPEPLAELAVLVDEVPLAGAELAAHGTLAELGDEDAVPDEGVEESGVAELVESEARRVVQVETPEAELASVPVASLPEVAASVLDEFDTAEAPVEGEMPAPPAVGLCRSFGFAALPAGAPAVAARFGAVETVASTTPTMAWIAGAARTRPAVGWCRDLAGRE
jgi:hypothetical protein